MDVIISIILWIILFFVAKHMINKSFESQKRLKPKTPDFHKRLYEELQPIYHLKEKHNKIELNSNKFSDLVADGKLIVSSSHRNDITTLTIQYKRRMKFTGVLLVFLGLLMCYVGVVIPILIVQSTKRGVFKEIEKIFEISEGI